jgi:hypothetical protein
MRYLHILALVWVSACTDQDDKDDDPVDTVEPVRLDADADGVNVNDDCDDNDPDVFPGAAEVCDGKDNDCDGDVDDRDEQLFDIENALPYYEDRDRDGVGAAPLGDFCVAPQGSSLLSGDCNDNDATIFPGNAEVCNFLDDDCDDLVDDQDDDLDLSSARTFFADLDGDGRGDPSNQVRTCDAPSDDYVTDSSDCDDAEPAAWTDAVEICDGIDNDCDGDLDDADADVDLSTARTFYRDADGDGYGNRDLTQEVCAPQPGLSPNRQDCDDRDAAVNPDAVEVCDGVDNDCDGDTDDADAGVDLTGQPFFYQDLDRDGEGDPATAFQLCDPPVVAADNGDDCDDDDDQNFSTNVEVCDGGDNDCDGLVDDADASVDASTQQAWFIDSDGDGRGALGTGVASCTPPNGRVNNAQDCNDAEPLAWTGADEVCDDVDNDCDGLADDDDSDLVRTSATFYYPDADGDGFGDVNGGARVCDQPAGSVTNDGDCDDSEPLAWTGAPEICDGIDNNCVGGVDGADPALDTSTATVWYADRDGDGRGDPNLSTATCSPPNMTVDNADDCDDSDPLAWTGADEVCDGSDNDCDGATDDADPDVDLGSAPTWYRDADGDGFGDPLLGSQFCRRPNGVADNGDDCDDTLVTVSPAAPEICDGGRDNDCDGVADDDDGDLDGSTATRWYLDTDGDGFGDPGALLRACVQPANTTTDNRDCDDDAFAVNPSAAEVCDGIDNNCVSGIDDADPNLDPSSGTQAWLDRDQDTWGDPGFSDFFCVPPAGTASRAGDCDDNEPNAFPGNQEVCDGVDNDCANGIDEDDPSLDPSAVSTWYVDNDGDGFGQDGSGFAACNAGPGAATQDGDCNDNRDDVFPGAPEICDGRDNNCDSVGDTDDSWWDTRWPYRVLVEVTGADTPTFAPSVGVEVDFGSLLSDAGDPSTVLPASVRVVRQDCATGNALMPSEYMDDVVNVFGGGDIVDPMGDGVGTIVFLHDNDGDYATPSLLNANETVLYGVYFASTATAGAVPTPNYPSTLDASLNSRGAVLSNQYSEAEFETASGGLVSSFGLNGSPSVGAQTAGVLGNGVFFGDGAGAGGWVSASSDNNATVSLLHEGPVFAAVRTEGTANNAFGGFDYTYTYYMLEGRPELYVDAHFQVNQTSVIGPVGGFWGTAVRPYYFRNDSLIGLGPSEGAAELPGYGWVRATYDLTNAGFGVAVGYRSSPLLRSRPSFTGIGQWAALTGQDIQSQFVSGATTYDAGAGDVVLDHAVMAVLPHDGVYADIEDAFLAILDGAVVTVLPIEAL